MRPQTTIAALALAAFAALGVASGCSAREVEMPELTSISEGLPEIKIPVTKTKPVAQSTEGVVTVADVLDRGCSTKVVKALSEQIIAEGNCIRPNTYARFSPPPNTTLSSAVFPYLLEPARDALVEVLKESSDRVTINSMLRTLAQQYLLYDWYKRRRCGIKLAASPGNSNHQSGLAIDISPPQPWRKPLARNGFRWMGERDRWHFDFIGKTSKDKERIKRMADSLEGLDVEAFQRLYNRNNPGERKIAVTRKFDEDTEQALRSAPIDGFPIGPTCRR